MEKLIVSLDGKKQKTGEAQRRIAKALEFHSSEPKSGLKGGNEGDGRRKERDKNGKLPVFESQQMAIAIVLFWS